MSFTPNFAGIINALKYIIENGVAGSGGSGGSGGATATKQDEQTNLITQVELDTTNISSAIGSQNDGAASSDNPLFASLISLFKRLLQRLTALLPQDNDRLAVRNDTFPIWEITNLSANSLNADLLPITNVENYRFLSLQVFGIFNAVYSFQASNNGINWENVNGFLQGSTDAGNFDFAPRIISIPINFRFIRVRVVTYTSGTIQGHAVLYKEAFLCNSITGAVRLTAGVDTELAAPVSLLDSLSSGTAMTYLGAMGLSANSATGLLMRMRSCSATSGEGWGRLKVAPSTEVIQMQTAGAVGSYPSFNLGSVYKDLSFQIQLSSGSLTALTVNIEGSLNNANWVQIATTNSTINGVMIYSLNQPVQYIRLNITNITGSSPSITIFCGAC